MTALKHIVKANVLAMWAILEVRPDALFFSPRVRNVSMPTAPRRSSPPKFAIRSVGRAYKQLIASWHYVLPAQSVCLTVSVVLPSEFDELYVVRRREWLGRYHHARRASTEPNTPTVG